MPFPPVSKILWGTNYENQLLFGYPLQNVITDRRLMESSMVALGVRTSQEDASRTGREYTLEADVRYIPPVPDGRGGVIQTPLPEWQEFLDWVRDANAFRFVPDVLSSDFYIPNCYFEEPLRGFGSLEAGGERAVHLQIVNPLYDFNRALRGLSVDYSPGGLVDAWTFARSTVASYQTIDPLVNGEAAINVLRDRHYNAGRRVTLIEGTITNLIENGNYEGDAAGVIVQGSATAVRDTVQKRFGAASLKVTTANVTFSGVAVLKRDGNRFAATAGEEYSTSVWVYVASADAGKKIRLSLEFWDVSPAIIAAAHSADLSVVAGWQRIALENQVAPANTVTARVYVRDPLAEGVWDFWIDAVQVENNQTATSEILTGTGALTRNNDVMTLPWLWRPQAQWIYVKFIDPHGANFIANQWPPILGIGNFASPNWGLTLFHEQSASDFGISHGNSVAQVSKSIDLAVTKGDLIELLGIVFADGSVQLIGSKNGGADVASTVSAGVAMPSTFVDNVARLGGDGSTPAYAHLQIQRLKMGFGSSISTIALARAA